MSLFLDMSTITSNAMQQLQQTAVQKELHPVARCIPTGLEQFDMAAGEEAPDLQEQVDKGAASYARLKTSSNKKSKTSIYK